MSTRLKLRSELVDYHDIYLPSITTNMSKASHLYTNQPTYCLLLIYLHKTTYTLAPSRVHAKWTGSNIIKYTGEAFRLWTCLGSLPFVSPTSPHPSQPNLLLLSCFATPLLGHDPGQGQGVATRSCCQEEVDHKEVGHLQDQLTS